MAELRNISWGRLLKDVLSKPSLEIMLKSRSLQWSLTTALRKQGMMVLDWSEDLIVEYKGLRYKTDLINYPRIFEAYDRYRIEDVRKDDVVVDLGANIGSFSLPASRRARAVYTYEPLFYNLLMQNLALNGPSDWGVFAHAVGLGGIIEVDCQEYGRHVPSVTFEDVKKRTGHIDFLRIDIGGQEWNILPDELRGIRNLEIEFHFWSQKGNWPIWRGWLLSEEYSYTARWSKHKHWLYLSARMDGKGENKELHLPDGSFRGESLRIWKS